MGCNHCEEFSRAHLLRRAAAQAGQGLPSIEPGMPLPAGTGLNRRSFLLRSSAAMLSVYGASRLRSRRTCGRGSPAAAGNDRVLVSIFLDGGVDSLSVLAPDRRPEPTARCARPGARQGAGTPFAEDDACAGIPPRRRSTPCTGRGRCRCCRRSATTAPTSRTSPRATTGRSARCEPTAHRLDGTAARPDRHARQPASGAVARRLAVAGAGDRVGPGGGDHGPVLRPLGRNVWGEPEELMYAAVGDSAPRRRRQGRRRGQAAGAADQAMRSKAQLEPFSGEEIVAAGPLPRRRRRLVRRAASRRSRRCSRAACRSAAPRSRRPARSTPTTTRPTASPTTSSVAPTSLAAFQADLEARGLADRVLTLVWSEFGRRPEENDSRHRSRRRRDGLRPRHPRSAAR